MPKRCPTPLKTAYSTRRTALMAIARRGPVDTQLWPYKCACHQWHMTSQKTQLKSQEPPI